MLGRRYAIGDIHGHPEKLIALLRKISLSKEDKIFFVGDYIDRGPNSKGVLDVIMKLQQSYNVVPLLGNHEYVLIQAFFDDSYQKKWATKYPETLASFGVDNVIDIPTKYLKWMGRLQKTVRSEDHIISHAGTNFLAEDYENPLFRDDVILEQNCRTVVGHKTHTLQQCLESATGPVIFVDAGCGKSSEGKLIAYCLDDDKMYYV